MRSVYFPIADNGGGLSRTKWSISMCALFMSGVLKGRDVQIEEFSFPYPDGCANLSSNAFLQSKFDSIFYIDTDIVFEPKHVAMLLEHDLPIVAGIYPMKKPGLEFPMVALKNNPRPFDKKDTALCEVQCVPRGFTLIHRNVFEAIAWKVKKYRSLLSGRDEYEFWRNQPGGHSDDFNFCDIYRSVGGRVFVDQRCTTQHCGNIVYPIKGTYPE